MSADEVLRECLNLYVKSIEAAENAGTAERVWETGDAASLIYPLGWERGWRNIRRNFYEKVMAGKFRDRHLNIVGKPVIRHFDGFSLIEFAWDFEAVSREDGARVFTRGRESQVYLAGEASPKLVHVHYSLRA
ncbi:nuclear transport factor 2 family protein [Desulfovibrio sp.]|uniref:nuclear transport factor 2 family protein n=1 Tax=Desulfovibrio sp. TaxID=885 RepID=UPI0023C64DAB|nr:nuclear transport factor 2 family protein [Desulfovibrio sp.]MDE7240745.1 nuclear transport factor 2 family protein [Desulfovibrio sp.]